MRKPPLCTPSRVGMLWEEERSVAEIAKILKQPESLVRRYLKMWKDATPHDRNIARAGTRPLQGK